MSVSIGIVGLPNVGKSTLFTALTRKQVDASNYPFATIEPNVGVVAVPDDRLERLAEIVHPSRIVPATVEFVDIAGLVKGASEGEGLGNQFLANIRETDAIAEVVRFFSDPNVIHVAGAVDPDGDVETIRTELVLADLGTLEKALARLEKDAKRDAALASKLAVARRLWTWMEQGHRAARMEMTHEERRLAGDLHLLTMKPMLYVANVDEDEVTRPLARDRRGAADPDLREGRGRARRPRPGGGRGVPRRDRARGTGPEHAHPRRLRAARPHVVLHRGRDGGKAWTVSARREGARGGGRHPHRLRERASSRRRSSPTRTSSRSAGRRARVRRGGCASRAGLRRARRRRRALPLQRVTPGEQSIGDGRAPRARRSAPAYASGGSRTVRSSAAR